MKGLQTMEFPEANIRRIFLFVLFSLGLAVAPATSLAQTVSVSPSDLSFGIPTGTPPPLATTDMVTVNLTGTGQATLSGFAITGGPYAGDFTFNGNTCATPQTAPTTCQIGIQFTSTQPAGVLETATLSFTSSTQNAPFTVPLNGAYGAIKLFGPIDINPSLISYVTWLQNPPTTGYNVQTTNLNLSCPAGVTATLSSTPDGSGNVFQDNTIQFVNTVGSASTTTTDVCTGGDTNFDGFTGFPAGASNCFQASYESGSPNYVGQNPDLATYPLNGGAPGSFVASYGVAPVNVAPFLTAGSGNSPQLQSLTVDLQDAGGDLGAATLHLVTSCSPAGITPGGTVTGNPISPSNPASLTQTYALDSSPAQNIAITDNVAQNPPTSGAVPSVTDIGVPQQLFYQLVAGTSAASAVCLRMSGELDSLGNPMCKGFLIQCTISGTTSGDNCDPTSPSTARILYDSLQFASPDAPVNGYNFLYSPVGSPAADSCTNALIGVAGAACAQGTGPGMLMGSDNWLIYSGSNPPNTSTPLSPPTYSTTNCELTGSVAGDLCPLNTLTQFLGAADVAPGGTTAGKNSVFVPVVNVPLPSTSVSNQNYQSNGWVSAPQTSANLIFTANPASYNPTAVNPPANGFVAAPTYSVTYGVAPASNPLPDPTYPVAGDITLFNPSANPNFADPLCSNSTSSSFSTPPVNIAPGQDGIYNLHFFTTDCALTEELAFNPQGTQLTDPTANWASFRYLTFGVDTVAPTYSCSSPNNTIWYDSNQNVSCLVTDQDYVSNISGSGFSPVVSGIQGGPTETVNVSTNVANGTVNSAAQTNTLPACDLAANCVPVSAGPFKIDLQPPTLTGPTLSSPGPYYLNGPAVTVSFTCSDGLGSGVASCAGVNALPGGGSNTIANGGAISASAAGNYTITVTAFDNAGNKTTSLVAYTVGTAASADVAVADIPLPLIIAQGKTGDYYPWVVDLSSATANNVAVTSTFTVPNKVLNGSLTASYGLVSCSFLGCNQNPKGGTPCSVSTTVGPSTTTAVISCHVGQLVSISKSLGELITVQIPVLSTAPVNSKFSSVTTVTSDNDPNPRNNSVTESYSVIK
jgi:hypothetical protein